MLSSNCKCAHCNGEINGKKNIFINVDGKILCCSQCAKEYTKSKGK